jgi:hypothetical protein
MIVVLLFLALLTPPVSAQTAPASAPLLAVLERRHLDEIALRSLGYILEGPAARHLGPSGQPEDPALTPEQLEERLAALERGAPPLPTRAIALLPPVLASLDVSPAALGALFDGRVAAGTPIVEPASATPPPAVLPYQEPPFDASWSNIESDFRNPKTRTRAVKALAARFQKDPASETGLGLDAPEALRLLAREIHEGRGGDAAAVELKRELATAANLRNLQKFEFSVKLTSPLTVFVALSRSRATHSLDSRLYFDQMIRRLDAEGRSLSAFLVEQDPDARRGADFLLRAHSYDALMPHLERRPAEAGAIAPLLFAAGRAADVSAHADALEGLLLQLSVRGRTGGAAASFTKSLIDYAAVAPPDQARRIAVYLKLNEKILPRALRPSLAALNPLLPPGVLEDAGLVPPEPRDTWPTDGWLFTLHFASTSTYAGWRSRFLARGYIPTTVNGEPALSKIFNGLEIMLVAKIYQGDEDDFLRGAQASRFLASVTKDLRDPFVQGVILRTHAQFRISNLFSKKVNPGKLLLDGACRSAWDLRELRRRCPSCQFILNTGTGRGKLNNDAVIAVVEGLAKDLDWDEIGSEFARTSPSTSARIQGPWTPPFAEALRVLEARERADIKAAAAAGT